QDILLKGVLGGYGLRWPVRDYFAPVDSPSQLVETHAVAAEAAFECRQIDSPQVRDCLYLKVLQFLFGDFAYSGQTVHRQRQQERIYFFRLYDKEPIRFFPVQSNLREE